MTYRIKNLSIYLFTYKKIDYAIFPHSHYYDNLYQIIEGDLIFLICKFKYN